MDDMMWTPSVLQNKQAAARGKMKPRSILRRKGKDFDASASSIDISGYSDFNGSVIGGDLATSTVQVNPSTAGFGTWRHDDGLPGCRTCCERTLVCWLIISLLFIASTISVILLLLDGRIQVWNPRTQNVVVPDICITPACVQTAARIQQFMNTTADPCEDFYTYACGNWMKDNIIPIGQLETSVINQMQDKVTLFFKEQLEYLITESDDQAFQSIRQFYKSCQNFSSRTENGFTPAMDIINALGGFHQKGEPWTSTFDLTALLANMTRYDSMSLFDIDVLKDGLTSGGGNVITISPPQRWTKLTALIGLPKHVNTTGYGALHGWLASLYRSIYSSVNTDVLTFASEMMDVSIDLSTHSYPIDPAKDYFWNAYTTNELSSKLTAKVNWTRLFKLITGKASLEDSFTVYVVRPEYFKVLDGVLGRTSNGSINNLIHTAFLIDSLPYLSQQAISKMRSYISYAGTERVENDETDLLCIKDVLTYYPFSSELLYIERYFTRNASIFPEIDNMTNYIREGLITLIQNATWIDNYQKKKIVEKVNNLKRKTGDLDELYKHVRGTNSSKIVPEMYYNTVMELRKAQTGNKYHQKMNISTMPFARHAGDFNREFTVTSFYNPQENLLKLQTAILAPPLYTDGAPNYINYGSLGFIIGHQMNHGLDLTGARFDKHGVQVPWWPISASPDYERRSECFSEQYGNITVSVVESQNITFSINGNQTLQENIADVEGLRAAYQGYKLWKVKKGKEQLLPGFHSRSFTQEQLFFIATAQGLCQRTHASEMERIVAKESIAPNRARVIGMMRNVNGFAEAFKCKANSYMNPAAKCRIW